MKQVGFLWNRTVVEVEDKLSPSAVKDIILLLEFCLKTHTSPSKTSSMNRLRVQPWVPSQPHCRKPLHGVPGTKSSKYCPQPLGFGACLWMTPLSSTRRSTNKTSFNTSIVLTLPSGLEWRTTRRMGPSPSWTPLSNQRLMVVYPSLCTGNPYTQTSTYSGIATITSQPNSVSSIPSPIGPKQCAAGLQLLQQEMGPP